ncbi:microtubule severing ATPase Spg4 [Schizosaccharomyces osmophilus]|uniref:Microtubule severing ATPase Spg4 n=1 Tax=Schizosaccharomyces osmophilus TaxID=2545709 RepID=A0AAF0AWD2_9SCHI|nr:microtubule severing ATPase Spg4 [Schizosaccharomyces osmophilus]WBW74536.1 microtubule severing ATPase Spg4 [Schizosaccharomyces osmophilus]
MSLEECYNATQTFAKVALHKQKSSDYMDAIVLFEKAKQNILDNPSFQFCQDTIEDLNQEERKYAEALICMLEQFTTQVDQLRNEIVLQEAAFQQLKNPQPVNYAPYKEEERPAKYRPKGSRERRGSATGTMQSNASSSSQLLVTPASTICRTSLRPTPPETEGNSPPKFTKSSKIKSVIFGNKFLSSPKPSKPINPPSEESRLKNANKAALLAWGLLSPSKKTDHPLPPSYIASSAAYKPHNPQIEGHHTYPPARSFESARPQPQSSHLPSTTSSSNTKQKSNLSKLSPSETSESIAIPKNYHGSPSPSGPASKLPIQLSSSSSTTNTLAKTDPASFEVPEFQLSSSSPSFVHPANFNNPFLRQLLSPSELSLSSVNDSMSSRSVNDGWDISSSTEKVANANMSPFSETQTVKSREEQVLHECPEIEEELGRNILREIVVKGDEVLWDDIAGLNAAKESLKEAVVYPFLRPDLFQGLREPARGMLLFGPPGTGKTMLARAVATESKSTFFSISASSLTSKFLGESEKLVRALFTLAKKLSPSIIFVDEIDSLLSARSADGNEHESSRRIKTEFLIQWSSLARAAASRESADQPRVLVLAATNVPWSIDEAARRRFVRRTYIPLPDETGRRVHIKNLLQHQKHYLTDEDIEHIIQATKFYSGSDLTALAKDAAMGPLRALGESLLFTKMELIRPINLQDFLQSLRVIRPSVNLDGLERYDRWNTEYGQQA